MAERIIRSGLHEYVVLERRSENHRWIERWLCRRCGQITTPDSPSVGCAP